MFWEDQQRKKREETARVDLAPKTVTRNEMIRLIRGKNAKSITIVNKENEKKQPASR
jgi:hypothetical protein